MFIFLLFRIFHFAQDDEYVDTLSTCAPVSVLSSDKISMSMKMILFILIFVQDFPFCTR